MQLYTGNPRLVQFQLMRSPVQCGLQTALNNAIPQLSGVLRSSRNCPSEGAINTIEFQIKILLKMQKKWTLKIQKSKIINLVQNRSSICAVFPIVWFAGNPKTALTWESLYIRFTPGQSGGRTKCIVHVELPKQPINQFKLDQ